MGLAVDNTAVFEFTLEVDKDKPIQERPAFLFRYVSYRDFLKIDKTFVEAEGLQGEAQFAKYLEAISVALVGWKNIPIDFSPDHLADVVTVHDIIEIRLRLLDELTASEMDKKKAKSPSPLNTVVSVSEIKDTPVNAETAPANLSQ